MKILHLETYEELLAEVNEFWNSRSDKPEETPNSLLKALWHTACGAPVSAERALQMTLPPLDNSGYERLRGLLDLKKTGIPLAHLTQRQNFLGLEFFAGPDALIPRKETEILGRAVLAKLKLLAEERGQLMVVDMCTGSGNLALAYAYHEPAARVYGSDIAGEAVTLARRNALQMGLHERVNFLQGDLFAPFESGAFSKCDILSCNPPYISTAKVAQMHHEISRFEPGVAFDGGPYGISVVSKLVKNAPRFLKPSSWLAFEVGLGNGDIFARQLQKNPAFCEVETHTDTVGNIRAILCKSMPEAHCGG